MHTSKKVTDLFRKQTLDGKNPRKDDLIIIVGTIKINDDCKYNSMVNMSFGEQ